MCVKYSNLKNIFSITIDDADTLKVYSENFEMKCLVYISLLIMPDCFLERKTVVQNFHKVVNNVNRCTKTCFTLTFKNIFNLNC